MSSMLAALSLASALAGRPAPAPPGLCPVERPTAFTCRVGAKSLAVCGKGANAVYRFGAPGRIEAEAGAPTFSFNSESAGGESQISFHNGAYTYTVYDWAFRRGFGPDGHNNEAFIHGVLVRRGGTTLADLHCTGEPPDATRDLYHAGEGAPEGAHVEHKAWCPAVGVVRRGRVVRLVQPKSC